VRFSGDISISNDGSKNENVFWCSRWDGSRFPGHDINDDAIFDAAGAINRQVCSSFARPNRTVNVIPNKPESNLGALSGHFHRLKQNMTICDYSRHPAVIGNVENCERDAVWRIGRDRIDDVGANDAVIGSEERSGGLGWIVFQEGMQSPKIQGRSKTFRDSSAALA
jgi:hypothetical protein